MYKRKSNNSQEFNTCVTVTAAECGGNAEKMVRKFSKKVKKEGITAEIMGKKIIVIEIIEIMEIIQIKGKKKIIMVKKKLKM